MRSRCARDALDPDAASRFTSKISVLMFYSARSAAALCTLKCIIYTLVSPDTVTVDGGKVICTRLDRPSGHVIAVYTDTTINFIHHDAN